MNEERREQCVRHDNDIKSFGDKLDRLDEDIRGDGNEIGIKTKIAIIESKLDRINSSLENLVSGLAGIDFNDLKEVGKHGAYLKVLGATIAIISGAFISWLFGLWSIK